MSQPEKTLEYKYSDKIWTPLPTFDEGDCFFHAVFGEEAKCDGEFIYFDKQVYFRKHYWCSFLLYYLYEEIPEVLLEIFQKCFVADDSFQERSPQNRDDFQEYIRKLMIERSWVLVEEIPILATLWNVKVVLFLNDQDNPRIIEPNLQISGSFPFKNVTPLQEKVVRLVGTHFEKLIAISEANKTMVLDKLSSGTGNRDSFSFDDDIDDTIYSNKKNYNKGGSAGVQGGLYQVTLLSLVLLNALKKVKLWVLSTENPSAGKFDDLVFESEKGAILVQAKHKEGTNVIKYNTLLSVSPNANFSLAKYYFSFQTIKTVFNIEKIVICTNAKLQIEEKKVDRHTIDEDSLLHFKATRNQYYSFNENIIPDLETAIKTFHKENNVETEECFSEDCIKEFLGVLQFFDSFMEDEAIDSVIGELIPSIPLARNLDSKDTFGSVHKVMLKWFKERKGRYLRHLDAKAVFCDIRTSKYCDTLQNYNISFNEDNLNRFKEIQILHIIPCVKPTLNVLKLYQSLIKNTTVLSLLVNPQDDKFIQLQAVNVFSLRRYKFLVMSCPIYANDEIIRQMCEKLTSTLNKYKDKILILIADVNDRIVEQIRVGNEDRYRQILEDIHFKDLSDDCQEDFRTKRNIRFQGIDMTLGELVPDINDFVDAEVLEKLARNDRIEIGTEVKHTDDDLNTYYILRNLKRGTENISEANIRQIENLDERVVLISDSAGMGKTTILANLAICIKTDYPSLWVVRIDLNNCASSFKNALRKRLKSISITDLLNDRDNTKLDSKLMEKLFFREKNVVLLLDAVDEVSPGYMNLVMGMISDAKLQKNFAKIFITTRPHLCNGLEEKLKVNAFSLQPFSKENQEDFLTNYWIRKLNLRDERDEERCRQYACALIQEMSRWIHDGAKDAFAGIPLQTRMLAEVFQEKNHLDEGETNEWEECKEFISSDKDFPQLPKTINLIQLYNLFIKKKRDIFVDDKGNTGGNSVAQKALMDKFEECHKYHRSLALSSLFYPDQCTFFRCFQVMEDLSTSFIFDYLLPVGIMQIVDRNFCFIHRTFAEYFAAQSIMFELKQGDISESFGEFFLEEILIREEFHVVRAFLDSFIQKELGSIPESTLVTFSEVDYLSVLSHSWKSYLHLFAQEGLVGIMEFFTACINFGVTGEMEIGEDKVILATATDMKGNTPLHEACYWGHLNVIKSLIEHGAEVNYVNVHGETPLHKAVYKGHFEITKFLVYQAGANLTQENGFRENVLLLAVQRNHLKLAKFLINLNVPHTGTYTTALHLACYNGQLDFVRYLVETVGIDIESRDVNDCTPLHAAAHEGHLDIINYLVGKGCKVNAVNGDGNAAFHDAALRGFYKVVQFLCENGADAELQGELGNDIVQLKAWMREVFDCENLDESGRDEGETRKSNAEHAEEKC